SIASSEETARTSPLEVRSSVWPERPILWMRDVTCRGELYWTTRSTVPMSMPSSSVLVETRPLISPPLKPASTRSRSSRGTEPLEADGKLDAPSVPRELMDLIDDDIPHLSQVTLHQLPGEDRL